LLYNVTSDLASPALEDGYASQLADSATDTASLWQLALALADRLPTLVVQQLPNRTQNHAWMAVLGLMVAALTAQRAQREREPASAAVPAAVREGWALLSLLPKLASAAQTSCGEAGYLARLIARLGLISELLPCSLHDARNSVQTAAEVVHLLEATAAAVSLLPLVQQVWQARQGQPTGLDPDNLAVRCLTVWSIIPSSILALYDGDRIPPGSAEEHAAAAQSALHLHLTSCRAINWLAGTVSLAWLECLQRCRDTHNLPHSNSPLTECWDWAFVAFLSVNQVLQAYVSREAHAVASLASPRYGYGGLHVKRPDCCLELAKCAWKA
jgi:hypothetical protein